MKQTITKYVEVDVDVDLGEIVEDLSDEDLEDLGLRRDTSGDDRTDDRVIPVLRALHEYHENTHRTNSMLACPDEPCTSINTSGIGVIDEARQSHWGRD